jgi:hypothetical protein
MNASFLTTSLGWIDFSKEQRNRVGAVLDLLKLGGMVDELGIGTVRDLLSDRLFPGISTIQTRAKYFFYVPYILRDYQVLPPAQKKKISSTKFFEQKEFELMWDLSDKYKDIPNNGVIGISIKRGNPIIRRPSAIYWNGIYRFGLINTGGLGANSFLKAVNKSSVSELLSSQEKGDEGSKDDADIDFENIFKIKVPYKGNWKDSIDVELESEEAEFLQDQISSRAEGTLLALLLNDDKIWEIFSASESFQEFAKASIDAKIPALILKEIQLAHDFSELMYGSNLYYNLLLQKRKFDSEYYKDEWDNWQTDLFSEMILGNSFDPNDIFSLGRVNREATINFIKEFWQLAKNGFNNEKLLEKMILAQEFGVKGTKARLFPDKLHDVIEEKKLGLGKFEYRFRQAKVIINDIRNPK